MSKAIGAIAVVALLIYSVALVFVLLPSEEPAQSWCSYNEGIRTVPTSINISVGEHAIPFLMPQSGQILIQFSYSGYVYTMTSLSVWVNVDGDNVLYFIRTLPGLFSNTQSTTLTSLAPGAHVVTVIIMGTDISNSLNTSILCVTYTPI